MLEHLKRMAFRTAKPFVQSVYRQFRGLTIGTRTLILNENREVLLIRHTYAPGWLMPGGGVERGETVYQAAAREVREEVGVEALEEPVLHGVFLNDRQFPGDHVACFVLRRFRELGGRDSVEIAEARFFPVSELPDGTTPGTRRRIAEVTDGAALTREW
jgi:ADP-ribose pyrophosphatase YjhB (NUDIX family)